MCLDAYNLLKKNSLKSNDEMVILRIIFTMKPMVSMYSQAKKLASGRKIN